MHESTLRSLLEDVAAGRLAPEGALERLRTLPFEDLGFARVDHHRLLRQGMAEVVYAEHKSPEQVVAIAGALARNAPNILITRARAEVFAAVQAALPEARYHPDCGAITLARRPPEPGRGPVLVVAAGTADRRVAAEAVVTAGLMTAPVDELHDVGVAGLHRLLAHLDRLRAAKVVVVVAGMDGALPSVVGGLVAAPVIAVPTSVGYGASLGGIAALLTMLNSCAPNVAAVNIDNGFGAGYLAATINRA